MTVNPKKLRPYDTPPKRRRSLIPEAPDSAATGFFVAAGLWLALATALGVLAIGMRFVDFSFTFGLGIFDLSLNFDVRRVDYAFVNATVYGWLTNAGFAAVAFMTPRLLGRRLAMEKGLNGALVIWNLSLAGGLAALYVFDLGPHAPLTAIPWLFDGGLALGALIVTGAFFATVATSLRGSYVSIWFAGVALLALLGLVGLNASIGLYDLFFDVPELLIALESVYNERAISVMWLLGMAYATLHYAVPRGTGQPLAWAGIGMLSFVTWLVLAPVAGLATTVDVTIPYAVTSAGIVATMLLLVPASLTVVNLVQTMQGRWTLVFGTGTAAFAIVALAFLFAATLLEAIGALRAVDQRVGGTDWERGAFVWAAYGTFTFAAFALAEHALPRMLKRAWGGGFLSGAQLWLAFGGATVAGLALMGGGLAEGSLLAQGTAPDAVDQALLVYRAIAFGGFGMVALAGLAFLTNLFLMYTSGEPVEYVVPGQSATAAAGH
ncbi:MAG TPA: cbb3-type cytochrome c oxidase subunit I [Candidatus Limnocylindrales bacterium]|nr:cbb3-type cytochrome c oxidase subunit I [Candidatus Limnocylindrales bacterium]